MNSQIIGAVVAALVVGLAGGAVGFYALAPTPEPETKIVLQPDDSAKKEATRLRQQLADKESAYEQLLAERNQLKRTAGTSTTAPAASALTAGTTPAESRKSPYAETARKWQEGIEAHKQSQEARYQDAIARLQQRRQAATTPEETALVDEVTNSLDQLRALSARWEEARKAGGQDRMALFQQLFQDSSAAYESYSTVLAKDRKFRLNQLATQAGYTDPNQAAQFTDNIQKILTETDSSLNNLLGMGGGFKRGLGSAAGSMGVAP